MKKLFILFIVFNLLQQGISQTNTFPVSGNVGIGTINPYGTLDLAYLTGFKLFYYGSGGNTGYTAGIGLNLTNSINVINNVIGGSTSANSGTATWAVTRGNGIYPYNDYTDLFTIDSRTGNAIFTIGNVNIGTTNIPIGTKLSANGGTVAGGTIGTNAQYNSTGIIATAGLEARSIQSGNAPAIVFHHENVATQWMAAIENPQRGLYIQSPSNENNGLSGLFISGNVGIGTTNPQAKLDVNGNANINGNIGMGFGNISSLRNSLNYYTNLFLGGGIKYNGDGTYTIIADGGSNYWAGIKMDNGNDNLGDILFFSGPSTGGNSYNIDENKLLKNEIARFRNGSLAIGTTNPGSFKLAVEGTIGTRKVVVTKTSPFPDYVFNKEYNLPSLLQIEQFIKANKHLPEVPTAKEVERNGLDVGDNQTLLLKKIEELTLYLIEQNKKNEQQNNEIKELRNQLLQQQKEIEQLKVKK